MLYTRLHPQNTWHSKSSLFEDWTQIQQLLLTADEQKMVIFIKFCGLTALLPYNAMNFPEENNEKHAKKL